MISVCAAATDEVSRLALRLEEAINDRRAAFCRQVERQAALAESFAQFQQHLFGARVARVDLVDDDEPAQAPRPGEIHHALGHRLDTVDGAHDDHRRLDRLERAQRAAEKVGISRGVDHVDATALRLETADGGVKGVEQGFLLRIEVADRGATGERPLGPDCTGLREQGFGQQRLARAGLAHEGDIANVLGCVGHVGMPPLLI